MRSAGRVLLCPSRRPPPDQDRKEHQITYAAAPERNADAEPCDRVSCDRRTDRAGDVVARVVDRDRAVELGSRHQHRRDQEPRRRRERAPDAEQERRAEQPRRARRPSRDRDGESDRDRDDARLRGDQEPARVDDIGDRAGRQGKEKHRQGGGDLHRGNHERARIKAGHQPGGSGVEHRERDAG